MQIISAMLPEPPESQDRVFATPNAAIVLDGASAFVPLEVSTGLYVDTLGGRLQAAILSEPTVDLVDALSEAIESTAGELDLIPGASPSSTVAIVRERGEEIDLLVLGDTQIATPHGVFRDDRLRAIAANERRAYQDRLRAGHGYDEGHRALLRGLQTEQARHRNRRGGYWIAEASSDAAHQALRSRHAARDVPWCVLATDGAYEPLEYLDLETWQGLANLHSAEITGLLNQLEDWESKEDSTGRKFPRAKLHDDKSVAVARISGFDLSAS